MNEEELAGYDWLKSFMDRNFDAAERRKEGEPDALSQQLKNSDDFEPEQNSSTNSIASLTLYP
jgi:hypothetical protein